MECPNVLDRAQLRIFVPDDASFLWYFPIDDIPWSVL